MILIIDNYDSFVYNLYQYIGEIIGKNAESEILVKRNDKVTIEEIRKLKPSHIVLSPGPGTPDEAGICEEVVKNFYKEIPILGVCLGHQVIGKYFGGKILRLNVPYHGKTSVIKHDSKNIFEGIENEFDVVRYHSLIVDPEDLNSDIEVTAVTEDVENKKKIVMAMKHKKYPLYGLQFHPESIKTSYGKKMIKNFLGGVYNV